MNQIFLIMKKILFILICLVSLEHVSAQDETEKAIDFPKNEFSFNALNFLLFKSFDVTYERAINNGASVGINTMFSLDGNSRFDGEIYYYEGFTLTPYYRMYFGKKPNAGFFGEAFAVLATGRHDYYGGYEYSCNNCLSVSYGESFDSFTAFGIGLSFGVKLLARRNFIVNVHGGIARNFLNSTYGPAVTPRAGISFGWRF